MARSTLKRSGSKGGVLTQRQYEKLLGELQKLLLEGRQRAELAMGRELVETYHGIGKRLLAQKLTGRAGYGTATLQRLADDLSIAVRNLQYAATFARAYPDGPPDSGLRWAHYRELVRITDEEQRTWYEERAAQQAWSVPKLKEAIGEQRFRERLADPKLRRPKGRAAKKLRRPSGPTYVYKATIERVVDGDTLVATIDLGFQVLKRQRLRLASMDTLEPGSRQGDRARAFVQRQLAQVDYVVLKTEKIDLYGRYVAHVFYDAALSDKERIFTDGTYLNQRLVDEGLGTAL